MIRKTWLLVIMSRGVVCLHAHFRKYSNEFLNIVAGARSLGMGGACIATVSDGTAGYWNPARLLLGGSYYFYFNEKLGLTTEASLETTFDGKRNTLIKSDVISIDPRLGMEFNYCKEILFLSGGNSNFQQALKDGDTTNQQKVWIYQPSIGAGFHINNVGIDYAFTNLANITTPLYTHIA
jgi:hypothetical protein